MCSSFTQGKRGKRSLPVKQHHGATNPSSYAAAKSTILSTYQPTVGPESSFITTVGGVGDGSVVGVIAVGFQRRMLPQHRVALPTFLLLARSENDGQTTMILLSVCPRQRNQATLVIDNGGVQFVLLVIYPPGSNSTQQLDLISQHLPPSAHHP